jgi:hypothetical protein
MGGKSDLSTRTDRPESGGADHDMAREKSGLLEREKQKFAAEEAAERAEAPQPLSERQEPFSVGHERNPLK